MDAADEDSKRSREEDDHNEGDEGGEDAVKRRRRSRLVIDDDDVGEDDVKRRRLSRPILVDDDPDHLDDYGVGEVLDEGAPTAKGQLESSEHRAVEIRNQLSATTRKVARKSPLALSTAAATKASKGLAAASAKMPAMKVSHPCPLTLRWQRPTSPSPFISCISVVADVER